MRGLSRYNAQLCNALLSLISHSKNQELETAIRLGFNEEKMGFHVKQDGSEDLPICYFCKELPIDARLLGHNGDIMCDHEEIACYECCKDKKLCRKCNQATLVEMRHGLWNKKLKNVAIECNGCGYEFLVGDIKEFHVLHMSSSNCHALPCSLCKEPIVLKDYLAHLVDCEQKQSLPCPWAAYLENLDSGPSRLYRSDIVCKFSGNRADLAEHLTVNRCAVIKAAFLAGVETGTQLTKTKREKSRVIRKVEKRSASEMTHKRAPSENSLKKQKSKLEVKVMLMNVMSLNVAKCNCSTLLQNAFFVINEGATFKENVWIARTIQTSGIEKANWCDFFQDLCRIVHSVQEIGARTVVVVIGDDSKKGASDRRFLLLYVGLCMAFYSLKDPLDESKLLEWEEEFIRMLGGCAVPVYKNSAPESLQLCFFKTYLEKLAKANRLTSTLTDTNIPEREPIEPWSCEKRLELFEKWVFRMWYAPIRNNEILEEFPMIEEEESKESDLNTAKDLVEMSVGDLVSSSPTVSLMSPGSALTLIVSGLRRIAECKIEPDSVAVAVLRKELIDRRIHSEGRKGELMARLSNFFAQEGVLDHQSTLLCERLAVEMRNDEHERFTLIEEELKRVSWKEAPYYLINLKWYNQWKAYIQSAGARPGPITNFELFDLCRPKRDLKNGVDYIAIVTPVWNALVDIYEGGPEIKRARLGDIYSEDFNASKDNLENLSAIHTISAVNRWAKHSDLYELPIREALSLVSRALGLTRCISLRLFYLGLCGISNGNYLISPTVYAIHSSGKIVKASFSVKVCECHICTKVGADEQDIVICNGCQQPHHVYCVSWSACRMCQFCRRDAPGNLPDFAMRYAS